MRSGDIAQSVLSPAGAQASSIHQLWSLMFWTTTIVCVVVLAFIAVALVRSARLRSTDNIPTTPERSLTRSVWAATVLTVLTLLMLLGASVWIGRGVESVEAATALTINIVGHQWWWEIEYEDPVASQRVLTANELHIPINRPIVLKVSSRDVIHSFWVPNLQGKRDLIPGYITAIWLQADRPGVFRGQCAEFCGLQHAHMALDVVAEPASDFDRWLQGMRQPAPPPQTEEQRQGHAVFMSRRCSGCHAINGTDAYGQIGPDLSHIASRSTIGAGTLPNTPDHMDAWVKNPQASKPGNQMPPNPLSDEESRALLAYLELLK
ncbi:MAG: cytochrome c oxidase subunit II [Vicinamibacterales bacterium]